MLLFTFYQYNPLPPDISDNEIFPHFIVNCVPRGLAGVIIASLPAAVISSINSPATITMEDWLSRFQKRVFRREDLADSGPVLDCFLGRGGNSVRLVHQRDGSGYDRSGFHAGDRAFCRSDSRDLSAGDFHEAGQCSRGVDRRRQRSTGGRSGQLLSGSDAAGRTGGTRFLCRTDDRRFICHARHRVCGESVFSGARPPAAEPSDCFLLVKMRTPALSRRVGGKHGGGGNDATRSTTSD